MELVALDDALTTVLWTLYFIEAQGYSIEHNIIFEDNLSTINLAVNGTFSSSKRTKHIKARFFSRTRLKKEKLRFATVPQKRCGVMSSSNPSMMVCSERTVICCWAYLWNTMTMLNTTGFAKNF